MAQALINYQWESTAYLALLFRSVVVMSRTESRQGKPMRTKQCKMVLLACLMEHLQQVFKQSIWWIKSLCSRLFSLSNNSLQLSARVSKTQPWPQLPCPTQSPTRSRSRRGFSGSVLSKVTNSFFLSTTTSLPIKWIWFRLTTLPWTWILERSVSASVFAFLTRKRSQAKKICKAKCFCSWIKTHQTFTV